MQLWQPDGAKGPLIDAVQLVQIQLMYWKAGRLWVTAQGATKHVQAQAIALHLFLQLPGVRVAF